MPILPTQWILPSSPPPEIRARLHWLHPTVIQILYNRHLTDIDEVRAFYGESMQADDPFRMKGLADAVHRLRWAIKGNEPIAVYGDFDADGVTSTALMTQTLRAFGADVMPYIPHRVDEGYGLNHDALAWLASQGIRLVITVDCGIRAVDEVTRGNDLGLDIIVTDHHSVGSELPPALTIVNPRQEDCPYPFSAFAGVGVAFKIAQGLLRAESQTPVARQPIALTEEDILDLVAIGTVADIMPLQGENRLLVQRGLSEINLGRRPGLRAILDISGTRLGQVDATAIGFRIGPRLNAAGRLHSAVLAYDLLMAPELEAAYALAQQLNALNRQRQQLTQEAVNWAMRELGDDPPESLILIGREGLNPGIVGLVASRLKEAYYRPAIVVELGDEEVRGSARSIPEFHITEALDRCAHLLVRYGGHAAAAGFTVKRQYLTKLRQSLDEMATEQLGPVTRQLRVSIDAVLELEDLDYALLGKLRELEPTGSGNPAPILGLGNLMVRERRQVGQDGNHLKLLLSDGTVTYEAIAFNQGGLADQLAMRVDVACQLSENEWQGRSTLQLLVEDIKPAGQGIPLPSMDSSASCHSREGSSTLL